MQEPQLVIVTGMTSQEKFFVIKTQTYGHGPEQHFCDIKQLPVKVGRKGSEAWKDRLREPNIGLVRIFFAPDLIAFLFLLADISG